MLDLYKYVRGMIGEEEASGGKWVTTESGTHIFIEGGKVTKGPAALVGKTHEEASAREKNNISKTSKFRQRVKNSRTIGEMRNEIYSTLPAKAKATNEFWNSPKEDRYKIGDHATFFRSGSLPESGKSFNYAEGKSENGISVYAVPWANSLAGLSGRDWYTGEGEVVAIGSDSEPIIKPIGGWNKFHSAKSKQSTEESYAVYYDKLAEAKST